MSQILEFAANHPLLVTAFVVTGALLVYNEFRSAGQARFAISPDQAVRLMNKGALVLDLRSADDYQAGHLAGARHVPLTDIDTEVGKLKKFRNKPVLAYDDRGLAASRAVARLKQAEFENVFTLRGGVSAWREEHLPLERKSGKK